MAGWCLLKTAALHDERTRTGSGTYLWSERLFSTTSTIEQTGPWSGELRSDQSHSFLQFPKAQQAVRGTVHFLPRLVLLLLWYSPVAQEAHQPALPHPPSSLKSQVAAKLLHLGLLSPSTPTLWRGCEILLAQRRRFMSPS